MNGVDQMAAVIGILATIGGGIFAIIKWHVSMLSRFATKEELKEMEARIREDVRTLDQHVQTMEAMWVAKGPG